MRRGRRQAERLEIAAHRRDAKANSEVTLRVSSVIVAILLDATVATGFCMADSVKERWLTLTFLPQETIGESVPTLNAAVTARPVTLSSFEDGRAQQEADVVGQGTDDNDHPFPWRTTDSIPDYARRVLLRAASGWGIRLEDDADLRLAIRLVRFWVQEKDQAVGSTYAAEVRVGFEIRDASDRVLGSGVVFGSTHRYGRKRSADNCNEVLSDAMKEAYAHLFDDASLQTAWSRADANAGGTSQLISASTLLAELVQLKQQGFGPEVLIRYVKLKTISPPLSAQDLLDWKAAGVEDAVTAAALERTSGGK